MWSSWINGGFPWKDFWLKPAAFSWASLRKKRLSRVSVGGPDKGWGEHNRHCMACAVPILSCRIPWQQRYRLGFLEGVHNPAKLFVCLMKKTGRAKQMQRSVCPRAVGKRSSWMYTCMVYPKEGGYPRATNATKAAWKGSLYFARDVLSQTWEWQQASSTSPEHCAYTDWDRASGSCLK